MATLDPGTVKELEKQIDDFTSDPNNAPGIVYAAVNKNGDLLLDYASGKIGAGRQEPMTTESVLWIASCTKMITGIACMQLVEQGKMKLDDVDFVEKIAPELKAVQVLENGKLVPKKQGITLRMLLSHTAGFAYTFFNQAVYDHFGAAGGDEFSGYYHDTVSQPLANQPGSRWEYGVNIDWAGILVERVTGMSLNDYFQEHIFKPMGISHINMFPTEEMKKNLAYMNSRLPSGEIVVREQGHLNKRPLHITKKEEQKDILNAGGAGCFARPNEYCQIIATLLNDGTHPKTGNKILSKETVDQMFTNQIPEFPAYGFQGIIAPKKEFSNDLPALFPDPPGTPQGWGLTFFLHLQQGAYHTKGTGWWAGLPNLFWWCDKEKGIGGIIGSQIVPFGDPKVMGLWIQIEAGIYGGLK